ncbi:MAG: hypothetical protein ACPHV3_01555 [Vibrio sp.]
MSMTCEFTWHQIKHRAHEICDDLNKNRPSEVGKLFVDCDPDCFTFQLGILPVDALHVREMVEVARLICHQANQSQSEQWQLMYFDDNQWSVYPHSHDLTALELLDLVASDPARCLWEHR